MKKTPAWTTKQNRSSEWQNKTNIAGNMAFIFYENGKDFTLNKTSKT
jgi:hypothetical protein